MNPILPANDLALFTDLYELTMAQAFFQRGMFAPATFSLFVRQYPPDRAYLVAAGLEDVLDYLENLRFHRDSLDYLRSTGVFDRDFLEYLKELRFTGSVRAIPEGRLFFADEPVLEVTAPIIEAQIAETFVINQVNSQSLLATKAVRCVLAARGRPLADFSARRTHGIDAARQMARCSYIAGFETTSNVLASQRYGIPSSGTMAHSFISSFGAEVDAFRAYAGSFPDRAVLLLDTYDTVQGAYRAATVARELETTGHRLMAVRLDSGDLAELSRQVRRILDEAGLNYVNILASGGLDEYEIETLVKGGAPIDGFGVGTRVGVSADAPWSDMAYKLVAYDGRPVMKLSVEKISQPGPRQVFRFSDDAGQFSRDAITCGDETFPAGEPLLETVLSDGRRTALSPALDELRGTLARDLQRLDDAHKGLYNPPHYPVEISNRLLRLTEQVRSTIEISQGRESPGPEDPGDGPEDRAAE